MSTIDKKNTHTPCLDKAYDFTQVENKWYANWLRDKRFAAGFKKNAPFFSIVIPPPNVTGVLHVGHALNNTMQDILVRFRRMQGYNTLWLPGTDHAGIATQNVVERQLAAEGKSRHDVGREKFIEHVWQWREESGGRIINQLKRLGSSCDWDRERFTMDEGLSRAVREVFTRLYKEGLIYRGDYIINWCPRCHTALADLEVEHEPTAGKLYHIRYPLADGNGHLTVATTRPETMLGDVAVAVHPDDERYADLVVREVTLPLVNRRIPIVRDEHVEKEFGTGALKVTPAHDLNDFEISRRHDLPALKIMDDSGVMNDQAGPYQGLDRFACRRQIIQDLETGGFLEKTVDHEHGVGHCYRCRTVVEPTLSKQWFVKIQPLADKAITAVKDKRIRIHPASWENTFFDWMYNIRDWCISRQIWWGHRIPAWTCDQCGEVIVATETPERCPACGGLSLTRETDVLDTWFSSALWPFSTLGWPDKTPELAAYYPTSVLITSFDILFFWVARMMMMGLHFMDEVPFRDVYLHALIRDEHGQKMSKSKGNVMDPLLIMDKYGTDSLRFTLAAFAAQGRDIRLSEARIEGYRHFINKIWNASRFALMHIENTAIPAARTFDPAPLGLPHRWILSRLDAAVENTTRALGDFRFNDAASTLYQFFWHEFCDWYLEWIKPELYGDDRKQREDAAGVLGVVLEAALSLLHPFIPFVTEEIWQHLPGERDSIMVQPFPETNAKWRDQTCEETARLVHGLVVSARNLRSDANLHPSAEIGITMACPDDERKKTIMDNHKAFFSLAKVKELTFLDGDVQPKGAISTLFDDIEVFLPLAGLVDIQGEIKKMTQEKEKLTTLLTKTRAKLANKKFCANAPPEIVAKEKDRESQMLIQVEKIEAALARLQEMEQ